MSKFREKILQASKKYYEETANSDWSHNFDHILRVERLAMRLGRQEKADLEALEAICLLFDVARGLEDKGEVADHAVAGAEIAKEILAQIKFPVMKIEKVCHAILVHRKSKGNVPQTLEAKIL